MIFLIQLLPGASIKTLQQNSNLYKPFFYESGPSQRAHLEDGAHRPLALAGLQEGVAAVVAARHDCLQHPSAASDGRMQPLGAVRVFFLFICATDYINLNFLNQR